MKFKKILAGAMVGTMVLANVTGVSAADAGSASTSIADLTCESFWGAFTDGFTITENTQFTITGTTTNTGDQNYQNMFYVFYSSDDTAVNGENYVEYFVGRSDHYGWDSTGANSIDGLALSGLTFTSVSAPEDWATWLAATQAGEDFTITVTYVDSTIQIELVCGDVDYIIAYTVTDTSVKYCIALGGESCTLTGITYTDNTGFSIPNMTVLAGGSNTFDITYTPSSAIGSNITYVSDNEHVTVEGNTVTVSEDAEDEETANITATYGDYTTTFVVTVTNTENPITTVTPSLTSVEVEVGSSATVTATYAPEDTTDSTSATWVSADESVAIVHGGVITGVAAGETTVTVTIGSVSAEIAVTVTEAASEEASASTDSDSSDSSDDSSTEEAETETEETVTTVEESETMTIESFWTSFTSGYEVTEDGLTITLTTTNNGTSNWENVIWVLYSSDSGYLCTSGADSDDAAADNYVEYYVGRADAYGWDGASAVGTATLEATYSDDFAWETWLAATQAGAEVTITAILDGDGNAIVTLECEDMSYTVTIPVNSDSTIYLALTGENCTLSDLTVNGESANFPVLVQSAVTTDDTEDTETEGTTETTSTSDGTGSTTTTTKTVTTSGSTTGSANTGDASPIVPIAVAVLGCAAVVVASKKRMA